MRDSAISIGIIGLGTVGTGVTRLLLDKQKELEQRLGFPLVIGRIADRSIDKKKGRIALPERVFTKDPEEVLRDPEIDIVVELIGGVHPAKEIILEAMKRGKPCGHCK